jgi:hypothetical protein
MLKFLYILFFAFARLFFSGDADVYKQLPNNTFPVSQESSFFISDESKLTQELPDETPHSKKRKKRLKGISYELIEVIPDYWIQPFLFADHANIFPASRALRPIFYCYGKRGPPALIS